MPKYGIEQIRFNKKWPSCIDSIAGLVEDSFSGNEFLRGRDVGSNTKRKKKVREIKREEKRERFYDEFRCKLRSGIEWIRKGFDLSPSSR